LINDIAHELGKKNVRVAVRFNPDVTANTHPYIATGHGGAKFGLTAEAVSELLAHQSRYPHLSFEGIHVHIGSNLQDTHGTQEAVERALEIIAPYESIKTLNMGGGLPAKYHHEANIPSFLAFANVVKPLVQGYNVLLEPGRAIIADAGLLVSEVLYTKYQAGQRLMIIDASMTELMRPMLYQAKHHIVPVHENPDGETYLTQVHGPVCETTDVMGRDVVLPNMTEGDLVAVLTAGAYGTVMASNYNARPRPTEVVVHEDGVTWSIARQRETWQDLIRAESI
jgi:diaminopimelate decarboxylase